MYNNNKLRESDDYYFNKGHAFSYNGDLIHSFDICGNCEAHALLLTITSSSSTSSFYTATTASGEKGHNSDLYYTQTNVSNLPTLFELTIEQRRGNKQFDKCPNKPTV